MFIFCMQLALNMYWGHLKLDLKYILVKGYEGSDFSASFLKVTVANIYIFRLNSYIHTLYTHFLTFYFTVIYFGGWHISSSSNIMIKYDIFVQISSFKCISTQNNFDLDLIFHYFRGSWQVWGTVNKTWFLAPLENIFYSNFIVSSLINLNDDDDDWNSHAKIPLRWSDNKSSMLCWMIKHGLDLWDGREAAEAIMELQKMIYAHFIVNCPTQGMQKVACISSCITNIVNSNTINKTMYLQLF